MNFMLIDRDYWLSVANTTLLSYNDPTYFLFFFKEVGFDVQGMQIVYAVHKKLNK